jgi:hypothetical protein
MHVHQTNPAGETGQKKSKRQQRREAEAVVKRGPSRRRLSKRRDRESSVRGRGR